jgi:hypothetical protein
MPFIMPPIVEAHMWTKEKTSQLNDRRANMMSVKRQAQLNPEEDDIAWCRRRIDE